MQIRKKFKYSKDNDGQINIIYNIPDEVYTNTRIKGEPFAKLKIGHPAVFKMCERLYNYDVLMAIITVLAAIETVVIIMELLMRFCVRHISMSEMITTVTLFLTIMFLIFIQCWLDKVFEKSSPYYIRAALFKAIVYDETRIYPSYSNKKKKITDIEIDCDENPYSCSDYIYCQFSPPLKNGKSCTVEFWFADDLKYETIIKRK